MLKILTIIHHKFFSVHLSDFSHVYSWTTKFSILAVFSIRLFSFSSNPHKIKGNIQFSNPFYARITQIWTKIINVWYSKTDNPNLIWVNGVKIHIMDPDPHCHAVSVPREQWFQACFLSIRILLNGLKESKKFWRFLLEIQWSRNKNKHVANLSSSMILAWWGRLPASSPARRRGRQRCPYTSRYRSRLL